MDRSWQIPGVYDPAFLDKGRTHSQLSPASWTLTQPNYLRLSHRPFSALLYQTAPMQSLSEWILKMISKAPVNNSSRQDGRE